MPQLHFYVSDEVADDLRRRAKASRQSVSKYVAAIVRRDLHPGWPKGYFEEVIGGWKGRALKRAPQGEPEERGDL
jgi:hypothetical protein